MVLSRSILEQRIRARAIRALHVFKFDDGHDTGIYSWGYLALLGQEYDKRWKDYLDALKKSGQSR